MIQRKLNEFAKAFARNRPLKASSFPEQFKLRIAGGLKRGLHVFLLDEEPRTAKSGFPPPTPTLYA